MKKDIVIPRDTYLTQLIDHRHNGLIKIVTGIRRCGKSFLLFRLFKEYLLSEGVPSDHIIEIALDDRRWQRLRDPDSCLAYVDSLVRSSSGMHYLLIDEVQYMREFEDVLNSFLHIPNLDVYVTGSNSRFLATDVITEFRGRGDEIHVNPLSFSDYCSIYPEKAWDDAWNEYSTFGGLPYAALIPVGKERANYLKRLFTEVYFKDILEHNSVRNSQQMERLIDVIASAIGSLTNPQRIENTFRSFGLTLSASTARQYLDYFQEAYLLERVERYDVKGRKYIGTPQKYYFTDIGLRNARLNFRQQEETHIMENVIYNELRLRGYAVDVGVVEINDRQADGNYRKLLTEIDFVANMGSRRYYVQSAFSLPDALKKSSEERPLRRLTDSFKKIVVVKDNIMLRRDEEGITTMGLKQFLLDPDSLDL